MSNNENNLADLEEKAYTLTHKGLREENLLQEFHESEDRCLALLTSMCTSNTPPAAEDLDEAISVYQLAVRCVSSQREQVAELTVVPTRLAHQVGVARKLKAAQEQPQEKE